MDKQIFFNGGFHAETEKLLSIQDRGLCFADGLFEVIRCVDGKFLLFSQHLQRMRESAEFLRMEFPYSAEELLAACRELARRNDIREGELYLELTRGEAPRYHTFPQGVRPNFFMVLILPGQILLFLEMFFFVKSVRKMKSMIIVSIVFCCMI